jgi:uncharacterized protein YndB with AHSA1/START domain
MSDGQLTFFDDGGGAEAKPVRFQIRRSFAASLETVFDAWLIPYLAGSWMFGPRDSSQEVITLENQPRPGGSFLFEVVRDGRRRVLTGVYSEIRRPEKLLCTIGSDAESAALTRLTMELAEEEGKTRMKLAFELHPSLAASADSLREQWTSRCKALADQVERSKKQARLFR